MGEGRGGLRHQRPPRGREPIAALRCPRGPHLPLRACHLASGCCGRLAAGQSARSPDVGRYDLIDPGSASRTILKPAWPSCVTLFALMNWEPVSDLDRLEGMWRLPSNATPLQRALAFVPLCWPAAQHKSIVIHKLCRELGIPLPWEKDGGSPTVS